MKHSIWTRLACLLMAACMFVLAGCNGTENEQPTFNFSEDDGPLVPYEETVTMTQVKSHNPNITYIDGESKENNFVTEFYKEKLNIVWETVWDADPAAYTAKLNLDIASDELPDVFVANAAQLNTLVEAGQILDLTAIYDRFASDKLKANMNDNALASCTFDGKLFAIPLITSQESDVPIMWMRQDWLDALNMEAPKTYDQLIAYVKAVKASGLSTVNGVTSSGLNFYGPGSQAFSAIAQTQGAYYDTWLKGADGKVSYSGIQPEMRAALLKMQEMYKAGLIDEDFAIKGSTEEALIAQQQYGIVFGQYFYGHLIKGSVLNNKNAVWRAYPIPTNPDGEVVPKSSLNVGGYYVVNINCKNPEALLKSMNLWMEVWTPDGMYKEWFTDEMLNEHEDVYLCGEYALPSFFDVATNNVEIGKAIRAIYAASDREAEAAKYPFARLTYNLMKDESNFYRFVGGEGWALKHVYLYAEKVYTEDYKNFEYGCYFGTLSEDSAFLKASLDKTMIELYYSIIMGEDISSFDRFVEEWKSQGGDQITAEVQEWVNAH